MHAVSGQKPVRPLPCRRVLSSARATHTIHDRARGPKPRGSAIRDTDQHLLAVDGRPRKTAHRMSVSRGHNTCAAGLASPARRTVGWRWTQSRHRPNAAMSSVNPAGDPLLRLPSAAVFGSAGCRRTRRDSRRDAAAAGDACRRSDPARSRHSGLRRSEAMPGRRL